MVMNAILRAFDSAVDDDLEWRDLLSRWLKISLALHLLAAVFSTGFYHWDEHFQIYEFANHALGLTPASQLPIEYGQLMRPWLQPFLYAGLAKAMTRVGIQSPFTWAFVFRLVSALLGWVSCVAIATAARIWIKDRGARKLAIVGLALIWFMPALQARASSENYGGIFFFLGLAIASLRWTENKWKRSTALWVGILFGLSFEFRYQAGVMIGAALLWMLLIARIPFRSLMAMIFGISLVIALGTVADRYGYGQWTFAPWHYLRFNLIEGHVNDVDHDPWWDIIRRSFTETWPPLGFVALLGFFVSWFRQPKHVLSWSSFALFAIHAVIGHKELRFIFPMAPVAPVMLALAVERLPRIKALLWPAWALVTLNLIALPITTLVPAWMPSRFYAHLYDHRPSVKTLYYLERNPFEVIGLFIYYYRPQGITLTRIDRLEDLPKAGEEPVYLFYTAPRITNDGVYERVAGRCEREFRTYPDWLEALNYRGILDRAINWNLLLCKNH